MTAQEDTPEPTNSDVFLHETPSGTFFVSQYAGFGQDDITVSLKVRPTAWSLCYKIAVVFTVLIYTMLIEIKLCALKKLILDARSAVHLIK